MFSDSPPVRRSRRRHLGGPYAPPDDEALHRALRVLFATSGTLRWDALRAHHRRLSGVSGASAVLSAVRLAQRRAAMRNSLILVVAMLAAVYVRRRL